MLYKEELILSNIEKQLRREIEIQSQLRYKFIRACYLWFSLYLKNNKKIRHPNILRLYGYFHDADRIFLILEFAAKGELFAELQKHKRFPEAEAAKVAIKKKLCKKGRCC